MDMKTRNKDIMCDTPILWPQAGVHKVKLGVKEIEGLRGALVQKWVAKKHPEESAENVLTL